MPIWQRWLPAAAVVVLVVGVVAGGIARSGDVRGLGLFRAGPTAELRTLDTGGFAFDYPAAWLGYDASGAGSGVSSVAVLGTQAVERRCGTERHVDLNCVYEQRLERGHIRLFVLTGAYRGQTVEDRPDIENGSTTRVWVGGMPALFDQFDPRPDSYYREDQLVHWEIALPGSGGTNVVRLEAMLKEPGVAESRQQLDALVASFRFANGPEPSATETAEPTPTESSPRLADLPVMTVKELIAAAASPSAREVVVRGWFARSGAILDCAIHLEQHPLIPHCADGLLYLMDRDTPVPGLRPTVPFVVPMLRVDALNEVEIPLGGAVEVQAVGHILDHRWTTCPAAAQAECKSRFVIDRVVPADEPLGVDLPTPWASPSDLPVTGPSEAVEVLSSVVGGVTVVSIGVADPDALRSIEWQTRTKSDLQTSWVVRALVGGDVQPVARTFLVGDEGQPTVFEATETGIVDLIGHPSSEPPTEVLGLPVMSVEEAIAIRDAGRDDREIAVRGWFPPSIPIPCPAPNPPLTSPIEPSCQSMFEVLMADDEQLIIMGSDGLRTHGPVGQAVSVALDDIDQPWYPQPPPVGPADPVQIVAIGHFDDRRSGWCHATRIDACRDRFVVDRVEWAGGATQPLSLVANPGTDDPLFAPVEATMTAAVPDGPILSAAVWRGLSIGAVEPALREGRAGITDQDAVWVVRVLREGRAVTYLVVEGTDRVYLVETDGQTVLVGGKPPDDPERTWPPDGVRDVTMPEGNTGLTPRAGVIDRTGLLVEARAASDGDPGWPRADLQPGEMAFVHPGPDTVVAYWNGTLCDDRFVLTVYGGRPSEPPDRVELRGERADLCRLALVYYGIRLRFSEPVDASAIRGWDRVGTPFETFPPVDSTVVFLAKDGGFDLPKIRVALVDLSSRVTAVRAIRPDDTRVIDPESTGGRAVIFRRDPSSDGRYQLYWSGVVCDGDTVVTIDASFTTVTVDGGRRPGCDAMGVERRLVIDIDGALDPTVVETTYTVTVIDAS